MELTVYVLIDACTIVLVLQVASSGSLATNVGSSNTIRTVSTGLRTNFKACGPEMLEVASIEIFVTGQDESPVGCWNPG